MDMSVLKSVGQISGIGGLALGVFLLLYRDVIRKNIFPKLNPEQAYLLLLLITGAVWSVALSGIAAWVYVSTTQGVRTSITEQNSTDRSSIVRAQTGNCGAPPVVEDGTLKGEIDGKANFIKSFVGDVGLKGQIEIAKNDVLQRYPDADQLRLKQYFLYVICLQIMNDTKLDTLARITAFREASQIVFPPLPPPKSQSNSNVQVDPNAVILLNIVKASLLEPLDFPSSSNQSTLLTPVDLTTIGFFVQEYPRELLIRLFISRIRVKDPSGRYRELVNDPGDPTFDAAAVEIINLLFRGFTIEISNGPSNVGDSQAGRVCFNEADAKFVHYMTSMLPQPPGQPAKGPRLPSIFDCSAWSTSKGAWYDLPKSANATQFSTRSKYAVYQYFGHLLRFGKELGFFTIPDDQNLNAITQTESAQNCFTSVVYKEKFYCVPNTANNMKRTFAILRALSP